jgi:hypothetical protein
MEEIEMAKWTEVTVKDTKGRPVRTAGSGDPAKAHKSADERMRRGYTKSARTTEWEGRR